MAHKFHLRTGYPLPLIPLQLQIIYLLLFVSAIFAGLWQYGHPQIVLLVLAGLLPAGLCGRLKAGWMTRSGVAAMQAILVLFAVGWAWLRFRNVALDLVIMESATILGLTLALRADRRYAHLAIVSLVLVGYGGMTPYRQIYMTAVVPFAGLGALLLYQTRTAWLAGHPLPAAEPFHGPTLFCRLGHFLVFLAIWLVLARTIPAPGGRVSGWFPVSFAEDQNRDFPPAWWKWLRSPPGEPAENGREIKDGTRQVKVLSQSARTVVKGPKAKNLDSRFNGGGAGMSKELLFQVRSPAKLYWLARLYDQYDGDKWTASTQLNATSSPSKKLQGKNRRMITQQFFVKQNVGSVVAAAYDPLWFRWAPIRSGHNQVGSTTYWDRSRFRHTNGMTSLVGKLPPLPWHYEATSYVVTPPQDSVQEDMAMPPVGPERYSNVPISNRLRHLARTITASCDTPLEKAMALRAHLRDNYTYSLTPPPIPHNREAVDFFLFETKVGYCVHFAQALTVLAWLNGLDARVATGYSPGNYNALTQHFEVHQYHAHAWTQIRVPPYGWLTFDGVAPAVFDPNPLQRFLRKLMDPFGDKWDSRPPELSMAPPKAASSIEEGDLSKPPSKPFKGQIRESKLRTAARHATTAIKEQFHDLWTAIKAMLASSWQGIRGRFHDVYARLEEALQTISLPHWLISLAVCLAGLAGLRYQPTLYVRLQHWRKRRNCRGRYQVLQQQTLQLPHDTIRQVYMLTNDLLHLAHYPDRRNIELDEYAKFLATEDLEFARAVDLIFRHYARLRFSLDPISDQDARQARDALSRVWAKLEHVA